MAAYTIQISEDQREALLKLINEHGNTHYTAPLAYWDLMLEELPKVDDTHNTVHGFCL